MTVDMVQRECNNINCYASTFSIRYRYRLDIDIGLYLSIQKKKKFIYFNLS